MIDKVYKSAKTEGFVKIGDMIIADDSLKIIVAEVLTYLKNEHIKKTREGCKRNGTNPGRPKVSQEKQEKLKTMIAEGKKNAEIERVLKLSPKTVRKYRAILFNEGGKPNESYKENN